MENYLETGKIINTHGVNGQIKIEHWCDSANILANLKKIYFKLGEEFIPQTVIAASVFKRFVILKLNGIDTPEEALKLKNKIIYAERRDIPVAEGAYLICDLIGLDIFDINTGECYGKLTEITNGAASQLYEIELTNGRRSLIPAVREFIKRVDLNSGIYIKPIEGLLDL